MKQCAFLTLGIIIGLVMAFSRLETSVPAAIPLPKVPDKPQHVQWEYGFLQFRTNPLWTCESADVHAVSDEELAKKLKVTIPATAGEHMIRVLVLNRLGKEGWELVTHVKMGSYDFYRLKRRVLPKD